MIKVKQLEWQMNEKGDPSFDKYGIEYIAFGDNVVFTIHAGNHYDEYNEYELRIDDKVNRASINPKNYSESIDILMSIADAYHKNNILEKYKKILTYIKE